MTSIMEWFISLHSTINQTKRNYYDKMLKYILTKHSVDIIEIETHEDLEALYNQ